MVRNTELFELIHTDLCEFEGILTRGGIDILSLLLMIFQNTLMCTCWKTKSDAFEKLKNSFLKLKINLVKRLKDIEVMEGGSMNLLDSTLLLSLWE